MYKSWWILSTTIKPVLIIILGDGCPKCISSKGEIKIENILISNNIKYKSQYSFDDLRFKKLLKFDFGIIDNENNLKYLIEFNGIQHYEFRKKLHKTEEEFEKSLYRDNLKKDYCIRNKIKLFIIKYNDNLEEKLNEIITFENKYIK